MKLLAFLVAAAVICADAKPTAYEINDLSDREVSRKGGFSSDISECHGIACPSGTVACSKTTKTSTDKKTLLTTIQCEDVQGNILNAVTKSTENPYENTLISSFSFTGHYNYRHEGGIKKPVYHNTYYNNNNEEVETLE